MKLRNTLILLAIFVILLGYVYFAEIRPGPAREEPATKVPILTVSVGDIESLTVRDNKGDKTARIVKDEGGTWRIEQPSPDEADQTRVERLIKQVAELTARRMVAQQGEDLTPFGLAEPLFTARIGLKGGEEEVLHIGEQNPQRSAYYVQRGGQGPVYLVEGYVINQLKGLITNPPVKPTPTRTPTPEVTPTPTPAATPTPTA
ncbi:MAG: DUF4340 domain-containing protein [Anaerolineae bacterium]